MQELTVNRLNLTPDEAEELAEILLATAKRTREKQASLPDAHAYVGFADRMDHGVHYRIRVGARS